MFGECAMHHFRVLFYNVIEQHRVDWDLKRRLCKAAARPGADNSKELQANVLRGSKSLDEADVD